jgi:hypothetical protein
MKNLLIHFFLLMAGIGLTLDQSAFALESASLTPTQKSSVPGEQQTHVANLIFPTLQEKFSSNTAAHNTLKKQIGVRRDTVTALPPDLLPLHFKEEASGAHSYTLHIVSPEAKAMRVGLKIKALPDSANLNFTTITSNHYITGADINLLIKTNIAADPMTVMLECIGHQHFPATVQLYKLCSHRELCLLLLTSRFQPFPI